MIKVKKIEGLMLQEKSILSKNLYAFNRTLNKLQP